MDEHSLPADVIADIDAGTARYREMRIAAALRRQSIQNLRPRHAYLKARIDLCHDLATQYRVARRILDGESGKAIALEDFGLVAAASVWQAMSTFVEEMKVDGAFWRIAEDREILAAAVARWEKMVAAEPMGNDDRKRP